VAANDIVLFVGASLALTAVLWKMSPGGSKVVRRSAWSRDPAIWVVAYRAPLLGLLGASAVWLFVPGGLMSAVAAVESGERARASQSRLGHLCHDCDRPATRSASYTVSGEATPRVLYFCEQHHPPARLPVRDASSSHRYNIRWVLFALITLFHFSALRSTVAANPNAHELLLVAVGLNVGYSLYLLA
jgi:hypothetical protein